MKKGAIILGIYSEEHTSLEDYFIGTGVATEVIQKQTKLSVQMELKENLEVRHAVIMYKLSLTNPYNIQEVIDLHQLRSDVNLIMILPDGMKNTNYVEKLYQYGIYNAVFDNDATNEYIVRLMKKPRKQNMAHVYYGLQNNINDKSNRLLNKGIINPMKCQEFMDYIKVKSDESLEQKISKLKGLMDEEEFIYFIGILPEDIRDELSKLEFLKSYFVENKKKKRGKGGFFKKRNKADIIKQQENVQQEEHEDKQEEEVVREQQETSQKQKPSPSKKEEIVEEQVSPTSKSGEEIFDFEDIVMEEDTEPKEEETVSRVTAADDEMVDEKAYHKEQEEVSVSHQEKRKEACSKKVAKEKEPIEVSKETKTKRQTLNVEFHSFSSVTKRVGSSVLHVLWLIVSNIGKLLSKTYHLLQDKRGEAIQKRRAKKFMKDSMVEKRVNIERTERLKDEEVPNTIVLESELNENSTLNMDEVTNGKAKNKLLAKQSLYFNTKLSICFCSLKGGTGCSYITEMFKHYIDNNTGMIACIVSDKMSTKEEDEIYNIADIETAYNLYNCILLDLGTAYKDYLQEVTRCSLRIMCSIYQEEYLQKLADFIKLSEGDWSFIFNYVTEKNKKHVYALMEDYETLILPIVDKDNVGKDIEKRLRNLITRGFY